MGICLECYNIEQSADFEEEDEGIRKPVKPNKMEQKHTPGPWIWWSRDSYTQQIRKATDTEDDLRNDPIAIVYNKEDAELIARAPELLEQVSALTKELEVLKQQHDFNCEYKTLEIVRLTEQVSELKSKLAKYEGDQIN